MPHISNTELQQKKNTLRLPMLINKNILYRSPFIFMACVMSHTTSAAPITQLNQSNAVADVDNNSVLQSAIYQQQQASSALKRIEKEVVEKQLATKKYQTEADDAPKKTLDSKCLNYDSVEVVGVTLLDLGDIKPIDQNCISKENINQFSRALTKAYLAAGYISTSLEIKTNTKVINRTPNIGVTPNSRQLTLIVSEGLVAEITSKTDRISTKNIFPYMIGKPLNIADLDQGIDHTKRLSSNKISVDVYPNKDGTVDLELSNTQEGYVSGSVGVTNSGSDGTGKWVGNFSNSIDSPLGIADTLSLNGSHSLPNTNDDSDKDQYSRSLSLNYSVPYGYLRAGVYGSYSNYNSLLTLTNSGEHEQSGDSRQIGVNTDYTFSRGSNHVSKVTTSLEQFVTHSYFDESLLENQSYKLDSAKLAVNHLLLRPNGYYSVNGFVEGNYNVDGNSTADNKQKQYTLYGIDASNRIYHKKLPVINLSWYNQHTLSARYAKGWLPAVRQTSLTSSSAVRGFNTLSSNAEKSIALQSSVYLSKPINQWLIEPYVGLDVGMQQENLEDSKSNAIGAAVGVKVGHTNKSKNSNQQLSIEYGQGHLEKADKKQKDNNMKVRFNWNY